MKRVVITSSNTAMWQPQPDGYVYTEKDWNTHSAQVVAEKGGEEAGYRHIYFASKVCPPTHWNRGASTHIIQRIVPGREGSVGLHERERGQAWLRHRYPVSSLGVRGELVSPDSSAGINFITCWYSPPYKKSKT